MSLKTLERAIREVDNETIRHALDNNTFIRKLPTNAIKQIDRENHTIDFVLSTDTVDRDGERVMPKAFEKHMEVYSANPVVLWAHDGKSPAVARMNDFQITDTEFIVRDQFAVNENEFAATLWKLYSADPPYMRGVSVGFVPIKTSMEEKDMLEGQTGRTFLEAELLEHSLVAVPSNRFALSKIYQETKSHIDPVFLKVLEEIIEGNDLLDPAYQKGESLANLLNTSINQMVNDNRSRSDIIGEMASAAGIQPSTVNQILNAGITCPPLNRLEGFSDVLNISMRRLINAGNRDGCDYNTSRHFIDEVDKRVTRFVDLPTADIDMRWRWNTSVQNQVLGSTDNPNWQRYQRAHIWYDPENRETKAGYKLPVAQMVEGQLQVVWRGVSAAMGALLGARGGVDVPGGDRRPIYNHLRRYYSKFDKEPPEFRDYEANELAELFPEESENKAYEGTIFIGGEFTVAGSKERDLRDVKRALKIYKEEVLGIQDMRMVATFETTVVCYDNAADAFYVLDYTRNADTGEIGLSNPRIAEVDFSSIGDLEINPQIRQLETESPESDPQGEPIQQPEIATSDLSNLLTSIETLAEI